QSVMAILWKQDDLTLNRLNDMRQNTLAAVLDMSFTEIGADYLKLSMPVNERSHQPYGLLHGGASAALAETVGSVASFLCIDPEREICLGIALNCNHVRAKRSGIVTATARPLHIGKTTHVWDIRIVDESDRLICVSRLTTAVRKK